MKSKTVATEKGNPELIEALNAIEKEKDISKDILLEAIENSLLAACKNQFGKSDNIRVNIDRTTGEFHVFQDKEVVEQVEDKMLQIHDALVIGDHIVRPPFISLALIISSDAVKSKEKEGKIQMR